MSFNRVEQAMQTISGGNILAIVTLVCLILTVPPVFSQSGDGNTLVGRIEQLEQTAGLHPSSSALLGDRLSALERHLLGHGQAGSLTARLQALEQQRTPPDKPGVPAPTVEPRGHSVHGRFDD